MSKGINFNYSLPSLVTQKQIKVSQERLGRLFHQDDQQGEQGNVYFNTPAKLVDKATFTKMGVWDRFKDNFRRDTKKAALGALYDKMAQICVMIPRAADQLELNRQIFNQIKSLVVPEQQNTVKMILVRSESAAAKNCEEPTIARYVIGGATFFEQKVDFSEEDFKVIVKDLPVEREGRTLVYSVNIDTPVILSSTNNNAQHYIVPLNETAHFNNDNVDNAINYLNETHNFTFDGRSVNNVLNVGFDGTEDVSAAKIQKKVRKFQKQLKAKEENKYGVRTISYTDSNGKKTEFLFSKNLVGYRRPKDIINNGASGSFKQIIAQDKSNVLFQARKALHPAIDTNTIEKILLDFNIGAIKVAIQIDDNKYIAHNAGEVNLQHRIENKTLLKPSDFTTILADMKNLHKGRIDENGMDQRYYHFDIKPANIQVNCKTVMNDETKKSETQNVLTLIDLDSFSSLSLYHVSSDIYTPEYINCDVLVNSTVSTDGAILFQVRDDYALALTLLESCGIDIPNVSNTKVKGRGPISIDSAIKDFINMYIKTQAQKNAFIKLLTEPLAYARSGNVMHLADIMAEKVNKAERKGDVVDHLDELNTSSELNIAFDHAERKGDVVKHNDNILDELNDSILDELNDSIVDTLFKSSHFLDNFSR